MDHYCRVASRHIFINTSTNSSIFRATFLAYGVTKKRYKETGLGLFLFETRGFLKRFTFQYGTIYVIKKA